MSDHCPGGDFNPLEFDKLVQSVAEAHPDEPNPYRLVRAYGTNVWKILAGPVGDRLECGLSRAELEYLVANEWAVTADDVLYRRSKLGIEVSDADVARLEGWMKEAVA